MNWQNILIECGVKRATAFSEIFAPIGLLTLIEKLTIWMQP